VLPPADEKAKSPFRTKRQELRDLVFFTDLLFTTLICAGLTILAPLACAQQSARNPMDVALDASYDSCPHSCADANQNAPGRAEEPPATPEIESEQNPEKHSAKESSRAARPGDFNRNIYYRNKLEFSLEAGWLPINIPFPFNVFEGDPYDVYPLKYTLAPIFASLRWHLDDISGHGILRGNWDLTFTGSATVIPRGPETRYFSYIMGIRRNFVPRNSRIVPYFDMLLGLGDINAKGPEGVRYAQGQDFTFTGNLGSGVRYNFNSRYAIEAGLNYMHISNAGLSEPKVANYGINVYGPMIGIDIQLRRHHRHIEH
jgi:Lipid A 3-O-deacylase (PagL)